MNAKYKPHYTEPVNCTYGAPMGRTETRPTDRKAAIKTHLTRVDLYQGYDKGGAYWGNGQPLWCADGITYNPETGDDDSIEVYLRAPNREAAKRQLLAEWPNLKFYR